MLRFWRVDAHDMFVGEVKAILLVNEPLNISDLMAKVKDVRFGGVVTFTGEVRSVTGEVSTSKLIYDAHPTMALRQMTLIAKQALLKWDANIAIAHRVGELLPGEIAVVCVAACEHRAEAFECCRFLIDRIKEDAPIWKKEFGPGGEAWV